MSLIAGDYSLNFCCGMIHKQEKRQFQHSRIDPDSIYPSDVTLVASYGRTDAPSRMSLSEYYNVDALWGFAIELRTISVVRGALSTGSSYRGCYPSSSDDDGDVTRDSRDVFQQGNFPSMAFRIPAT